MIPDSLQTIAEISIGLAGFSGLIGAMFLSLLPNLLTSFGVPESRIWFDSSAAMLGFSLVFAIWEVVAGNHIARIAPEIFNRLIFCSLIGGHVAVVILQAAAMTGFISSRAPGAFTLGLVWYLMHATYQFVRMLFNLPGNPKHV